MNVAKVIGAILSLGSLLLNVGSMAFNNISNDIELKKEVQKEVERQLTMGRR